MKENFVLEEFINTYLPLFQSLPQQGVAFYEVLLSKNHYGNNDAYLALSDKKIRLIECNQIYANQLKYSKEELFTPDFFSLQDNGQKLSKNFIDHLITYRDQPYEGYFQWKHPKKKSKWIKFSAIPIICEGRYYVLGLYTDITSQILVQSKLDQFNARLIKVAYGLKVPEKTIRAWFDLIQNNSQNEKIMKNGIQRIKTSLNQLFKTINDNLNYIQVQSGYSSLKLSWVSVEEIKTILDHLFDLSMTKNNLTWIVDFPKENVQIWADEIRVVQFLQNLIDNAVKATHQGSVKVTCKLLGGKAPSRGIELTVSDTGIGIPLKNQKTLFEPYGPALGHTQPKQGKRDSGLGLTFVKEIVEKMGGTILFSSTVFQGTTFVITLPHMEYRAMPVRIEDKNTLLSQVAAQ